MEGTDDWEEKKKVGDWEGRRKDGRMLLNSWTMERGEKEQMGREAK